ncbi:MAG: MGH1-like glycoside hydrolase domain-containing protein [bacterium]
MFSVGGIRSLSFADQYYGTGDNYWRGSVWININYMFLRGVNKHYKQFAN